MLDRFFVTIGSPFLVAGRLLGTLWGAIRFSFQTKTGRVRWSSAFILALTLWAVIYNYPQGYNNLARTVNEPIQNIEQLSLPSSLDGLKEFSFLQLPIAEEHSYRLGLDLVGGTQLLYDADTSKIPEDDRESALEGVRDVIERRVNAFGVAEPLVQTDRSGEQWRVLVELAGISNVEEAIAQIGETPLLEFREQDHEYAGPELTEEQQEDLTLRQSREVGLANDIITRLTNGEDFALLAAEFSDDPGSGDNGGNLGFATRDLFVPEFSAALFDELEVGDTTQEPVKSEYGYHIIEKLAERETENGQVEVDSRHILVRTSTAADIVPHDPNAGWKNTELSGKQLDSAQVVFDPNTNEPQVQLIFNNEGAVLFEEITGRNVGSVVGIFLDGQPISVPTVHQAIAGGRAVITGAFSIDEAKLLSQRLNAGALPVPITLVSQQTVGATLGAIAVEQSLRATLIGFALVALFMLLYYRLLGLISVLSLFVYGVLVLAVFKLWPVTLTLAGVTGFILSIGMAVDANILIFERIKEELRNARPLSSAVEVGFNRAWTSIRDSNASSLITTAILYWFGTSVVRGFALTLAIGIVVSMFSAIMVSRTFLRLTVGERTRASWIYGVTSIKKEA